MTRSLKSGAVIPVLLMLPNVIWALLPRVSVGSAVSIPLSLAIGQHVARAIVLVLPCFLAIQLSKRYSTLIVTGMSVALAIYYVAWARYFVGNGAVSLLSASLLGIPSPLLLSPIAFLLLSSYLLDSRWMLISAVVFGTLHVWVAALSNS